MKTITIGDIHGRSEWNLINPKDYDKIIFIGDYVDSFYASDATIIENLLSIIQFKKDNPKKVVLLWGNHDCQYLFNHQDHRCSGYRSTYAKPLSYIFNDNYRLFQLAFQEQKYLWTHAGVHKGWFIERMLPLMTEAIKNDKETLLNDDNTYKLDNIAAELNYLFSKQHTILFDVCKLRGGPHNMGGPLWADKIHTHKKPLKNLHQIVGHTKIDEIITFDINKSTSITFVDCLETKQDFYKLTI